MRAVLLLFASAALFAAWPPLARLAAIPGVLAFVALSVALALSVSDGASPLAAASGALGAFSAGLLSSGPTAVGGALILGAAYAERTARVRGGGGSGRDARLSAILARAAHVALALVAGGVAGGIVASFGDASLGLRAVAVVVASVLALLPCVIEADDLVAHALESIARDVDEPSRRALLIGAALRRHTDDALLDRATAKTVRSTWRALNRLAQARLRVQRAKIVRAAPAPNAPPPPRPSPSEQVLSLLDARIAEHVTALARAYVAVDTARAAELGLDDVALRTVESAGEALEDVSAAMMTLE